MKVLVTGAAGFIGYHVCQKLLASPQAEVLGVDNLNDYYPVELKQARLRQLESLERFRFVKLELADTQAVLALFKHFQPDYVVHLAAQAGVRYSTENPHVYAQANLVGFLNLLEGCRACPPKHTVFASSSSIYGAGATIPFSEDQVTDQPLSFYGATKKANELMAYSYAHLHGVALTGLRFFTVYGPWGRPDMSPMIFAKAILEGTPLKLFNHGQSLRDFTYIDDVVAGVLKVLLYPPKEPPTPPYRVFNLGHHRPVEMRLFVEMLESLLGKKAVIELHPPQPGDMPSTCANIDRIRAAVGFEPRMSLEEGLGRFVNWYKEYVGV
jgi:UDP-glucuronate 4-epimerase